MLRGNQLFNSLFADQEIATLATPERKGRSEALMQKRNELLVCRYYFYAKLDDKNYPWVIAKLEEETFIAQRTITDTIAAERKLLLQLRNTKPTADYFKKKYPWMQWRLSTLAN